MQLEITGKRYEEKLVTTSLKVSEVFGKEHKDVLERIRNLAAENSAARFLKKVHIKTEEETSRKIVECFEKRHSDVLKGFENLKCFAEFAQRNFALSHYKGLPEEIGCHGVQDSPILPFPVQLPLQLETVSIAAFREGRCIFQHAYVSGKGKVLCA